MIAPRISSWGRMLVFGGAALCGLTAGCTKESPPRSVAAPSPAVVKSDMANSVVPATDDVRLQILDFAGLQRLIASHRGNVVVMDAWSTACPPCVRDFPRLVRLSQKYAGKGVACVSLSFDYEGIGRPEEQVPRVLDFLRKQHATFDNVLSSLDADSLYKKLEIASVPVVFIYDRQGKLFARLQEAADGSGEKPLYDRVEGVVEKMIAKSGDAEAVKRRARRPFWPLLAPRASVCVRGGWFPTGAARIASGGRPAGTVAYTWSSNWWNPPGRRR